MSKLRKLFLLFSIVLGVSSGFAYADGKVSCSTTWDENYFYAAFQVDDPDITGVNSLPFSKPWEDDCVEVFIETDNAHAKGSTGHAYHMAVSSAGGACFSQGAADGVWKPKKIYSFKYSSICDGSLNNAEDLDNGYTVELAIPWGEMGAKSPEPGSMMSFNVLVRQKGDSNKFVSLSPNVKAEADVHDASKWVDIVFTAPVFGAATLSLDKIVSSKYITRMPLMDGQVRLKEYNKNTSFDIPLAIEALAKPKHQFQKMALTYYFYWYQGDPRKSAPFARVRESDGRLALTDQPIRGAGPWFSFDRVQWHKDELSDIRRAGIDIILPVYWGDPASRTNYSAKGLDVMVEAMRELEAAKKPFPLVGLYLDTTSIPVAIGGPANLCELPTKEALYGMIRDFFERVPEEYRAQVQMADERSGRPSYIVQLYSARPFSDLDSSFISYVNERFARDFDANIMWLGARDFNDKAPGLDGFCRYGAGLDFTYDDTAKIRIAAVGPGYDDCAVPQSVTPIRSREGGDTYRADWSKTLVKRPNWAIVDGWNQFREGSEICGSRQYGFTYIDATAMQALKFRGPRDYDAKFMRHNLPRAILPETVYSVDMTVQNDGIRTWRAAEGFALSYRWYKDGKPIGEAAVKRPLQSDILPGQSAEIAIGVVAVKENAEDLPEGDYEIRFEMVRMADDKWFSALGDDGLSVPIKIGQSAQCQARVTSVDGPVMVKSGASYTYRLKVRNDGTSPWKTNTSVIAKLLCAGKEVATAPWRTVIARDTAPGQIADLELTVNFNDPTGKPLPLSNLKAGVDYRLALTMVDGETSIPTSTRASGLYERALDIFDSDLGAHFVACDVPEAIDAGKMIDVKLAVRNNSPELWVPGVHSIGYHWYYLDGTEAVWDGAKTALKTPIRPNEPTIVAAKLTAPAYDGRYILAWDLAERDRWASTLDITRGGDLFTVEVTVQNGKLSMADLSTTFDTVASSPDRNRESGNFDGTGASFPAEFMPPDICVGKPNDLYPCGYNWTKDANRKISFRFGHKAAGDKNAVTCAGQTINVPKGKYSVVHILGAATEPDQDASFGIGYPSSVEPAKVKMSSWKSEPANGEEIALVTLQRHIATGDERGANCYLFRYAIPLDATRQISSIVLPQNAKVRVMAITLEKP